MKTRTRNMHQTATYWGPPTNDGLGNNTFPESRQIKVRWQERREMFHDTEGRERASKAVVYVTEPVETEGYLYLGESDAEDPRNVSAWEIKQTGESLNLRGTERLLKVWLSESAI